MLWYTVLIRSTGYHIAQFELFWSYKRWFAGDTDLGKEILANIAMFIPFGFLMSSILKLSRKMVKEAVVILTAILFSLSIETLQLFLMRGLFEWDDLVSNTFGAMVGMLIHMFLNKSIKEPLLGGVVAAISLLLVAVCIGVVIRGRGALGVEADTSPRAYCFQIDDASVTDGILKLNGFAFCYDQTVDMASLVLRPHEGDEVQLSVDYGTERSDVNRYFYCDRDYSNCGFVATGEIEEKEYEVMIQWQVPWTPQSSTGVFISPSGVHYMPETELTEPLGGADLDDIVNNGVLRVYRPDYHCWVYQVGWNLYWIVDKDFHFEDDGSTYIQYQMWTTQIQNLPEKRLAHHNYWDNIGGYFEDHELEGNFGDYRVMKREIPTAYSVTSIVTGYYKNGEWIWKNYFRPIYSFEAYAVE